MINFRIKQPKRTYTGKYSNYREYKPYLSEDFNHRCGYTDCIDSWFGGVDCFHIDHFLPKKKYIHLATDYSNLVYSCSYVNILKSDDEGKYLDPCNEDYNQHFYRDEFGHIFPNPDSPNAIYMYSKLKLYLNRYSIIWTLEQIEKKLKKLTEIKKNVNKESEINEINNLITDLLKSFFKYKDYLTNNL